MFKKVSTRRHDIWRVVLLVTAGALLLALPGTAQNRAMSPSGEAAVQVSGSWDTSGQRPVYKNGKWIVVTYGRPLLRERSGIFGEGESYGQQVNAGAPVWRAGANVSTTLDTEVALDIGGTVVPAGKYTLFIEAAGPDDWTFIVSKHGAAASFQTRDEENIWGAYGYSPDKDVARAKMTVAAIDVGVEQLTIGFVDVTRDSGSLALWWDKTMAWVPFKVAP